MVDIERWEGKWWGGYPKEPGMWKYVPRAHGYWELAKGHKHPKWDKDNDPMGRLNCYFFPGDHIKRKLLVEKARKIGTQPWDGAVDEAKAYIDECNAVFRSILVDEYDFTEDEAKEMEVTTVEGESFPRRMIPWEIETWGKQETSEECIRKHEEEFETDWQDDYEEGNLEKYNKERWRK